MQNNRWFESQKVCKSMYFLTILNSVFSENIYKRWSLVTSKISMTHSATGYRRAILKRQFYNKLVFWLKYYSVEMKIATLWKWNLKRTEFLWVHKNQKKSIANYVINFCCHFKSYMPVKKYYIQGEQNLSNTILFTSL